MSEQGGTQPDNAGYSAGRDVYKADRDMTVHGGATATGSGTANEFSGTADTVVQAQKVEGGVHFHTVNRRPAGWWLYATLGTCAAAGLIAGILIAHGGGQPTTAPGARPGATTAQSPAQPAPTSTPSSGSPTLPSGYILEYASKRFTMPGGGCGPSFPSSVTFGSTAPQVRAPSSTVGDFYLACDGTPVGIAFTGDQVALVTGSPDASACAAAVSTNPISGSIPFARLQPGMQMCLSSVGAANIEGSSGQLVLLTVISTDRTSYDLTWSATAWAAPSSN